MCGSGSGSWERIKLRDRADCHTDGQTDRGSCFEIRPGRYSHNIGVLTSSPSGGTVQREDWEDWEDREDWEVGWGGRRQKNFQELPSFSENPNEFTLPVIAPQLL